MKKKKLNNLRLVGKEFYLRPIQPKDIGQNYLSWMNDKKITQYLYKPKKKYTLKDLKSYCSDVDFNKKMIFAVISIKNNEHIGNMTLNPIDVDNKKTGLGGIIGNKNYWGTKAFIESMSLLIDYAFNNRGFIKIESGVYENNVPCIIASKKVGFKLEGIKKKDIIINNKSIDTYLFGMTNNNE
tara:strand:+ start:654 stop:1202 length:549 start_codon:yes stop_codon:yes gene_type:complete